MSLRIILCIIGFVFHLESALGAVLEDEASLSIAKQLIENIKNDKTNSSYDDMIVNKIMHEHSLNHHEKNQPFFYSNDRYVITDIINLVLNNPGGIIDETATTGRLKIYREFIYPDEIADLFTREKRAPRKFQDAYLGQMISGPTNKVIVALQVKGDEQNENTLKKRLAYTQNNIRYIDAYPVKDNPKKSKSGGPKIKDSKSEETNIKELQ